MHILSGPHMASHACHEDCGSQNCRKIAENLRCQAGQANAQHSAAAVLRSEAGSPSCQSAPQLVADKSVSSYSSVVCALDLHGKLRKLHPQLNIQKRAAASTIPSCGQE